MTEEFICRACLKLTPSQTCKNICEEDSEENSRILEMLSYSIPELDMYLVTNPVICDNCVHLLETTFKFKTLCLKNEEKLLKYSHSKGVSKINLVNFCKHTVNDKAILINNNNNYKDTSDESQPKSPRTKLRLNGQSLEKTYSTSRSTFDCEKCKGCQRKIENPCLHLKVNVSPFICYNCNKKFDGIGDLRKHMLGHTRQRKCKVCEKSFRDLNVLRRHLWSHTGVKTFACHLCPKKFQQKHCLTQHVQQHQGNDSIKCAFCHKLFSTKYNAKVHMKTAHRVKEFCDLCGETFYSKADLVKHLHTDSQTCGKFFKNKFEEKSKFLIEEKFIKVEPEFVSTDNIPIKEEPSEELCVKTEPEFIVANDTVRLLYVEENLENESKPIAAEMEIDVLN